MFTPGKKYSTNVKRLLRLVSRHHRGLAKAEDAVMHMRQVVPAAKPISSAYTATELLPTYKELQATAITIQNEAKNLTIKEREAFLSVYLASTKGSQDISSASIKAVGLIIVALVGTGFVDLTTEEKNNSKKENEALSTALKEASEIIMSQSKAMSLLEEKVDNVKHDEPAVAIAFSVKLGLGSASQNNTHENSELTAER